jgi:regulatory protein
MPEDGSRDRPRSPIHDLVKITAIQPQKNHAERLNVHVDGAFRLALAAEIVLAEGLRVGDEMPEARILELEARDQTWKAREAALHLLAFRPRTAAELRRRLHEKGYAPEVTDGVVERLGETGVVDDSSFAEMFVRDRVRLRPKGKRILAQELRARGVDGEMAQAAIEDVMERENTTDVDLARQAAARWRPRPGEDPQASRRRLYGFLARRGFASEAIMAVLGEALAPEAEEL